MGCTCACTEINFLCMHVHVHVHVLAIVVRNIEIISHSLAQARTYTKEDSHNYIIRHTVYCIRDDLGSQ